MYWYYIDERYLDYLRDKESRIPYTNYGDDKLKPFFGSLFEVDDLMYMTQVSHPKVRHKNMKNQRDLSLLYNTNKELIAVVNLNYMFPVPKKYVKKIKYKDIDNYRTFKDSAEKSRYIMLLKEELSMINALNIAEKAHNLYKYINLHKTSQLVKRCLNFKYLEVKAKEYQNK